MGTSLARRRKLSREIGGNPTGPTCSLGRARWGSRRSSDTIRFAAPIQSNLLKRLYEDDSELSEISEGLKTFGSTRSRYVDANS